MEVIPVAISNLEGEGEPEVTQVLEVHRFQYRGRPQAQSGECVSLGKGEAGFIAALEARMAEQRKHGVDPSIPRTSCISRGKETLRQKDALDRDEQAAEERASIVAAQRHFRSLE